MDDAACNAYLGFPHNVATIQRLDATLFAPVVSTAGEITDGVAAAVTPAYLCGALGADGGLITSYARTTFPEAGLPRNGKAELAGPCGVSLMLAQAGAAVADCRLNPFAGAGGVSGVFTTNSVVNPLGVAGPQTGSLITAYVPGAPPTDPGPAAPGREHRPGRRRRRPAGRHGHRLLREEADRRQDQRPGGGPAERPRGEHVRGHLRPSDPDRRHRIGRPDLRAVAPGAARHRRGRPDLVDHARAGRRPGGATNNGVWTVATLT